MRSEKRKVICKSVRYSHMRNEHKSRCDTSSSMALAILVAKTVFSGGKGGTDLAPCTYNNIKGGNALSPYQVVVAFTATNFFRYAYVLLPM